MRRQVRLTAAPVEAAADEQFMNPARVGGVRAPAGEVGEESTERRHMIAAEQAREIVSRAMMALRRRQEIRRRSRSAERRRRRVDGDDGDVRSLPTPTAPMDKCHTGEWYL